MVHKNVALVLGGGGSAGHAWTIGVIAGLAEAGIDMTEGSFSNRCPYRDRGRLKDAAYD